MIVDWNVFVYAVAIGAAAELLTLHYPSRYRQAVALGKVIAIAAAVAILPGRVAQMALIGLLIARVGDVFGELVHTAVVYAAVWMDERGWATTYQSRTDQQQEESISITSET